MQLASRLSLQSAKHPHGRLTVRRFILLGDRRGRRRVMREAIIVDGVRTASGKKNGRMKDIRPDDLGGFIIEEVVKG